MVRIKRTVILFSVGAFAAMILNIAANAQHANAQHKRNSSQLTEQGRNMTADIALSYISHTDDFRYGGMYTAFRKDIRKNDDKWEINCSTFSLLVALGIKFENSVYGGGENTSSRRDSYHRELAEYMKSGTEGVQTSYKFSQHIAQWLYKKGICFSPNLDLSNVMTGDIVFFNNILSDDDKNFLGIDHSGVFAYHIHDNLWGIWEVQNAGPVYAEYTHKFNSKIVLCARLPKETRVFSTSSINLEPTKKYVSKRRNLRPLVNLSKYKPGKQYTLLTKIKYYSPDLKTYPGIHDSENTSLCSYHSLTERPLDDIYKIPFVPQIEDTCIYLDTRISDSKAEMNAICEWAYVYEGLLLESEMFNIRYTSDVLR